jgi:hypothetical protein
MTVAAAVAVLPRRMAGWAARRSLAPNALTGIGLACSLCAAAWFTAGTRSAAIAGGFAIYAGYLAGRVGAQLVVAREAGGAAPVAESVLAEPVPAAPVLAESALAEPVPGAPVPAAPVLAAPVPGEPMLGAPVSAAPVLAEFAGFDGWLTGVCAAAGELAVYAGLAAGAAASHRHGGWVLAAEAAITLSIGQVARLCQPGPVAAQPARSPLSTLAQWLATRPAGGRAVLIATTAPLWGARITFLALIVWGAAAVLWTVIRGRGQAVVLGRGQAVGARLAGGTAGRRPIAACRDDGPLARWAGRVVQGQLVPLPPALAGLAATVLLAALGLGNLPGVLVFAPVAAMLLAAPGAGHPHDGRFDWVVPLVLQAGQYIYLAALGFSAGVPGPVTFGLTSMVALHQLDVACRARQEARWPGQRAGLGWDGRMLAMGLAAQLGLATFAYLALTAYLGWLLCRASLSGWLIVAEPDISEGERR